MRGSSLTTAPWKAATHLFSRKKGPLNNFITPIQRIFPGLQETSQTKKKKSLIPVSMGMVDTALIIIIHGDLFRRLISKVGIIHKRLANHKSIEIAPRKKGFQCCNGNFKLD